MLRRLSIVSTLILVAIIPSKAAEFFDFSNRENRYTVEGGIIATQNIELRGYNQESATKGWSKNGPTYRLEYWSEKKSGWNFGLAFQPLSLSYTGVFKNTLTTKGQTFTAGTAGKLDYDFPSLRASANYPIYENNSGDYIRIGGSALARQARVKLVGNNASFNDSNFIVFPVFNAETNKQINQDWSIFLRADLLPSIDGNIFLDGFFDTFVGAKRKLDGGSNLDFGVRSVFGGYDPKKQNDYANRIFYNSFVIRYNW